MVSVSETEVRFDPSRGSAEEGAVEVTVKQPGNAPVTRRQSSESSRRSQSGRCCPKLFDRASGSWWDPKFNSSVIEEQFQKQTFPQGRKRFRYAVGYVLLACIAWLIYLPVRAHIQQERQCDDWVAFEISLGCLVALCVALIAFTTTKFYESYSLHTSLIFIAVVCGLTLATFASFTDTRICDNQVISTVATFAVCVETILMTYTVIPIPFLFSVGSMLAFSLLYEILFFTTAAQPDEVTAQFVFTKLFLHLCVHMMGIHIFFMSQVRNRSTFLKVVEAMISHNQHKREKQIKEATIHSLMPDIIAKELLRNPETNPDGERQGRKGRKQSIFRPFYMNRMENVSILYADIAGFTKMSANKSAEVLVGLLNNLFGRFDLLCRQHNCEKICTLGDCYYCVSGCPTYREDHAICCVEMGLSMIEAIKEFCQDTGEKVNMRVGIHTGTVLCGIVGNRRFKFDVWSNDVTIANKMEASGQPGKVHVSAESVKFLGEKYILDEGNADKHALLIGMKTYFIAGRHGSSSPAPRPYVNLSTAAIDSQGANANEDTDSEKGDGGETKHQETQSRKPLLASNTNGANGSTGTPEKGSSSPTISTKDALENHAENPGGSDSKPENGDVVVGTSGTPSNEELAADNEISPLTLNESIILHHNEDPNTENQFLEYLAQESENDYFHKPPINKFTLRFLDNEVERKYHAQFLPDYLQQDKIEDSRRNRRHSSETISTTRYNTLLDVAVAFSMFILIGIGCFLSFGSPLPWAVFFPIVSLLQLVILLAVLREAFCRSVAIPCAQYIAVLFHHWYRRHFLGALLLSCPVFAIYANYSCWVVCGSSKFFFCFVLIVSLLHFCNFVQLNLWMKMLLALICGTVWLVLVYQCTNCSVSAVDFGDQFTTPYPDGTTPYEELYTDLALIREELVLDILLLLVLIFFLNREYEIGFRLNFYANVQALVDREKMQTLQEEAESLLHHIVPQFVTEQLRTSNKFSQNHENVAVIFCSIVNFNDFYEEAYEGGKECIRVLHELISDFDKLLEEPEYDEVEKIKTIGSTYMAACGLHPSKNPKADDQSVDRLVTLMNFSVDMMNKISQFNDDVLSMTIGAFNFVLRIGYNHGQLTSGVIGTTKLLYDIWGDTVNVASRMDSTGLPGRIQVTEHSMKVLEPYFEFEHRGLVKVRGKGEMMTYLLVKKREEPLLPVP